MSYSRDLPIGEQYEIKTKQEKFVVTGENRFNSKDKDSTIIAVRIRDDNNKELWITREIFNNLFIAVK